MYADLGLSINLGSESVQGELFISMVELMMQSMYVIVLPYTNAVL